MGPLCQPALVCDPCLSQEPGVLCRTFSHGDSCFLNRSWSLLCQEYVKNLVDFSNSVVGHLDRFDQIQKQLDDGHNVILLANHQTEADPGKAPLLCWECAMWLLH